MIKATATFRPRGDLGRFVQAVISPAVVASVQASCDLIKETAQGYCPVDTGALRDSITSSVDDSGSTVVGRVGPNMPYAEYVEYGTGRRGAESAGAGEGPYNENWPGMPAQPYMRPAMDECKPTILDLFRSQIATALS